ncbi:MAG: hypothetical protein ACOH12_09360 [Parvibaculaceae bacterium]
MSDMDNGKPEWDETLANKLLGSVVLVGITRDNAAGESHEQFYGTVERADRSGIGLRLQGSRAGEEFILPPHPANFFPAEPGSYRLHQSGEVVENPDFTTTWTIASSEH